MVHHAVGQMVALCIARCGAGRRTAACTPMPMCMVVVVHHAIVVYLAVVVQYAVAV